MSDNPTGAFKFSSAATLNIPMARKVLDHLRAHPEEHDQNYYGAKHACGTVMCIAGTTAMFDADTGINWDFKGHMSSVVYVNGQEFHIDERAAQLLGIDDELDADRLFYDFDNARVLEKLESWIAQAEAVQS